MALLMMMSCFIPLTAVSPACDARTGNGSASCKGTPEQNDEKKIYSRTICLLAGV